MATYNPEFQFNTWLISIAKNVHIDLLRKKRIESFLKLLMGRPGIQRTDTTPSKRDKQTNHGTKPVAVTALHKRN
jgi:RNA polymerase sigma-70 factor (ECF subfamily)